MSFFRFFRSPSAPKIPTSPRATKRRAQPRCEELERREVPTNDIFTVTGAANSTVTLQFDYLARKSLFWNEIGVYTVVDDLGRVGNFLPGEEGYAEAALESARTIFTAGQFEKAQTVLTFTAGTKLAYYLIQNNTLENWQDFNPNNAPATGLQAFFSIDAANRDLFDHVRTETATDRTVKVKWEDAFGGGDKDFNDAVFKITTLSQNSALSTGADGQMIPAQFKFHTASTKFKNEIGIFTVDDASGTIDGLSPDDAGYAAAALDESRRTILFARNSFRKGTVVNTTVPGSGFFGFYLIQNGTSEQFLDDNADNSVKKKPLAFFSFEGANPDGAVHMKWSANGRFSFEDRLQGIRGSDKDFNDFVGSFTLGQAPANSAPFVDTPIADITGKSHTAADQIINLASVFDDADMGNSRVRLKTNFGDIDLELFDRLAPETVSNFYAYILSGAFNDVIFHRSADTNATTPFVLQGGGFKFVSQESAATGQASDNTIKIPDITFNVGDQVHFVEVAGETLPEGITAGTIYFVKTVSSDTITISTTSGGATLDITADGTGRAQKVSLDSITDANTPTVAPENDIIDRRNSRGTIAMARSTPTNATSQFFFNLSSNTTLDSTATTSTVTQGVPFTVFGRVLDIASMERIDAAAAAATQAHASPFGEIPLQGYTDSTTVPDTFPGDTVRSNYFIINSVEVLSRTEFLTYTVTSSDSTIVEASLLDAVKFPDRLKLDFKKTGTVTITVTATDHKGGLTVQETFTVTTTNTAPVTNGDSYAVTEDVPLTVAAATGVLANDTDADNTATVINDVLTAILVTPPAHGTVDLQPNGSFTYTPAANYNGIDTFQYKANDGNADGNVATVTLNIAAVNDAPTAVNDAFDATEDTPLTIPASGVLGNDSDVDGNSITASLVSNAANGTVSLNANGGFTYSPKANFTGDDTFTYRVSDGLLFSNTATVTIHVAPTDDPPVAFADSYSTAQDTPLVILANGFPAGVLNNDVDIDNDGLTAVLVQGPTNGDLTLNADGSFSYIPDPGYTGGDSFIYHANDGHTDSAPVAVLLVVRPPNSAPFVDNAIADINTFASATNQTINLAGVYDDADLVNSFVRFNTNFGTIDIELFDRLAPQTVSNFYDYFLSGLFDDVIFHRSADSGGQDFVLQGGGFRFDDSIVSDLIAIANALTPTVAAEPDAVNRPNVRGTIAMARSTPNNATSQFFFNLNANSFLDSTDPSSPVTQGVPFTVFGKVANAASLANIDDVAALPTTDFRASTSGIPGLSAFGEVPIQNYEGAIPGAFPRGATRDNFFIINSVEVLNRPEFMTYSVVSNTDNSVVDVSIDPVYTDRLILDFKASGAATITISATDSVGHVTQSSFQVSIA